MKAKQINGQIVFGVPKFYTTETTSYVGDFDKQSNEVHEAEGFFEVVTPEYDPETEVLSELYFSEVNRVFTCDVMPRVFDLEELRAQRLSEFSAVLDQFAVLITKAKLITGDDDPVLNAAIAQTRQMRIDTLAAIRTIDNVEAMRAFRIKEEDVAYFKILFEPFV